MTDQIADKRAKRKGRESSLLAKVNRITLAGSFAVGMVMLIIGLSLYTAALTDQDIRESFTLARSAAAGAQRVPESRQVSEEVMKIYRSMTEEERADQYSEEYRSRFEEVMNSAEYKTMCEELQRLNTSTDIEFLYLGTYDRETCRLVYICDPDKDPATCCPAGTWEDVDAKEADKFLDWDGKGSLYHLDRDDRYGMICTSGYPLTDESGSIYGYVLADVTLAGVAKGMRLFTLQYIIALITVMIITGRLMNRRIKKTVIDPVNSIADAARSYVADTYAGIKDVRHFDSLDVDPGDEIGRLTHVMAEMEESITGYEEALSEAVAEKERAETELDLASRIQSNMLPTAFPAFPERSDFDIYASMKPARQVGGDFYDFFLIDDDHLAIIIADVTGKGIPAALFMMASMIILGGNSRNESEYEPSQILEDANNTICLHNPANMFVTVWLGILYLSTGVLKAANAGHEYPAIRNGDGDFEIFRDKHGLVLGAMENYRYKQYELKLEPGSKIFVYTDGVPEASNASNELFGTDRMIEALNIDPKADPQGILRNVEDAVSAYVGDAPQFDDLTMLCLEFKGADKNRKDEQNKKHRPRNVARWVPPNEHYWH